MNLFFKRNTVALVLVFVVGVVCATNVDKHWPWPPQNGTVWYVSPSGEDSNSGRSALLPLLTIGRAASLASANDRVLLMPGQYAGEGNTNVTFDQSSIEVSAQRSGSVLVRCVSQTTGLAFTGVGLTRVDGVNVTGCTTGVSFARGSLQLSNCLLSNMNVGLTSAGSSSVAVTNVLLRSNTKSIDLADVATVALKNVLQTDGSSPTEIAVRSLVGDGEGGSLPSVRVTLTDCVLDSGLLSLCADSSCAGKVSMSSSLLDQVSAGPIDFTISKCTFKSASNAKQTSLSLLNTNLKVSDSVFVGMPYTVQSLLSVGMIVQNGASARSSFTGVTVANGTQACQHDQYSPTCGAQLSGTGFQCNAGQSVVQSSLFTGLNAYSRQCNTGSGACYPPEATGVGTAIYATSACSVTLMDSTIQNSTCTGAGVWACGTPGSIVAVNDTFEFNSPSTTNCRP
mmetsp:Transcript_24511/g.61454  ORF Transcript_24511/g.61454 Transcript_24511/m.61454 type:complete len:453 (-) Transcript_24511:51-1409(-)|eukprot:CAMPEP_0177661732 /NCGR_PEP_ID=MMETSP0447-20121125/18866_1 /TAXON_ID=0 /ORGANISM="Stygamoeba regulata, Strain BSH-02190019" /LENGTH=452 /DNA_ID=CAMNT_0019167155 /DNA_START=50 /DNA_END=1408 /DNA_ORIENTATION=+